ncbi:MAG: ROK family protein [Phycisphaerales bacterium]|nr:MAG: ROK family protein [Phycisphaerales bacterium]
MPSDHDPLLAAGIDLGGTHLKLALVRRDGSVAARNEAPIRTAAGADAAIAQIVERLHALFDAHGVSRASVVGVGLGCPGPLSPSRGLIIRMANLPGWDQVPIRQRLADALALPVTLENDGNAAAFGEYWAGDRTCRDLVTFTLGTGVGGGIIQDGRICRGALENAAELGHTIVVPDGLACPCGQHGCLERYASAAAVARRVEEAVRAGEPCALAGRIRAGASVDSEDVAGAVEAGDPLCRRIWLEACALLAVACVNVQHTVNPRRILLGGGMALAGETLLAPVREAYARRRWTLHDDYAEIALARLGYDAGVIGAAGCAWVQWEETGGAGERIQG